MAYFLNAVAIKLPYDTVNKMNFDEMISGYIKNATRLNKQNVDYQTYRKHMESQKIPRAVLVPSLTKRNVRYKVNIGDTIRESELFADRKYGFWELHKINDDLTIMLMGLNRKLYSDFPELFGISETICQHISSIYDVDPMSLMSDGSSRSANSFVYYHNGRPTVRFDGKDCFTLVRDQYNIDINKILEGIYRNEDAILAVLDLRTTEEYLKQYKNLAIAIEQNEKIEFRKTIDEAAKEIMNDISDEEKKVALKRYNKFISNMKKDKDSVTTARRKAQRAGNRELVKKLTDDLKQLNEIIDASDDEKLYRSIKRQVYTDRAMFMEQVGYVQTLLNQRNYALSLMTENPSCKVTYFRLV